jgi:4-amino-4-deoxy-L-arabinose transferase-like glycosyltransferase
MIQRIQSVYLLLTTLLSVLFLSGNVLVFSEGVNKIAISAFSINKIIEDAGSVQVVSVIPFSVLLFAIPFISFVAIFLYMKRRVQMKVVLVLIFLIIALIAALVYFSIDISGKYNASLVPGIKLVLPVLMLVFSALAYRGVRNDEAIVKSYDRLR